MPKPNITFMTLRQIAESASGMRDQDLWFVVTGDPATYTFSTKPVHAGDDTEVIYVAAVKDPVSTVDCAQIGVPGGEPVDLLGITVKPIGAHPGGTYAADAVFWSVSAVEKFLVPYYASVYGDKASRETARTRASGRESCRLRKRPCCSALRCSSRTRWCGSSTRWCCRRMACPCPWICPW